MKKLAALFGATCGLALLAGCQSTTTTMTRIQEKSAVFNSLPDEQKKKIEQGVVEVGYTADMVYVALGRPTKVAVTANGKVGIWTYDHYLPTEGVSSRPLYALRHAPHGRTPAVLASGPSAPSAHDGGAMGGFSRGPSEGVANRSFTNWADPEQLPVTLHIMFAGGRVWQMSLNDENS